MERQNVTFFLNAIIIVGTLVIVLIDGILQGQAQLIGLFLSLSIITVALVANFIVNHDEIMELNAPGARLYQSVAHAVNYAVKPGQRESTR